MILIFQTNFQFLTTHIQKDIVIDLLVFKHIVEFPTISIQLNILREIHNEFQKYYYKSASYNSVLKDNQSDCLCKCNSQYFFFRKRQRGRFLLFHDVSNFIFCFIFCIEARYQSLSKAGGSISSISERYFVQQI